MNLVVGSTGLLGMEICRQLAALGKPTRALVRKTSSGAKRTELEALGIELVDGDLKDALSLRRACHGVESIISTASSTFSRQGGDSIQTVDQLGQLALADAAHATGVRQFVFVSFRANPLFESALSAAKRAVERHLAVSGLAYTILHASYFMEVWLAPALGFDPVHGEARIYGEGRNKISWVSYNDVARIAVASLDEPKARNQTIEIGGPEALSPREVLRTFETVGGVEIAAEFVPTATLQAQYDAATDPMQRSFAALRLQYASGDGIATHKQKAVFPKVQLSSVHDYASALLVHR